MREKGGQILGVVVNVVTRRAVRRDVNCAHPHLMRHPQIARVIFEHRGLGRVQPVDGKDRLKGGAVGFGVKARMLHPVDRIKQARKPARLQHLDGIGFAGVGVDDAPPRQICDAGGKVGVTRQGREIDVMDIGQIGAGSIPCSRISPASVVP